MPLNKETENIYLLHAGDIFVWMSLSAINVPFFDGIILSIME